MSRARRLVTSVAIDTRLSAVNTASQYSVTALLELQSEDGARVVLLDDRGWGASTNGGGDIWAHQTLAVLQETARMVVGPDGPAPGQSEEQEAAGHWAALAATAAARGVDVDGGQLAALPHDVHVSEQVQALLRHRRT